MRFFKKCGIPNALDGTEDDHLWQDVNDKESEMENCHDIFNDNLNAEEIEELLADSDNEPSSDVEEDGNIFDMWE